MVKLRYMILVVLSVFSFVNPAFAQDDEFEPFLQADFTILSGDVIRPNGIFWYDGFLYTSCSGDFTLYRIQDTSGETVTYVSGVRNAHTLFVEAAPEGDDPILWVPDFQSNTLWRISTSDGRLPVAEETLASPWGITPSATDDTFYITEWESDNIVNVTREGNVTIVARDMADPSGIVVTEELVYVANNDSARRAIEWMTFNDDGTLSDPEPLATGLQNVTNLILGPDGNLYIAYALGTRGVVGRIDPEACREAGGCTNVEVELIAWTELSAPLAGLTITPDMRLYVHTMFGSEIFWVQLPDERVAMNDS